MELGLKFDRLCNLGQVTILLTKFSNKIPYVSFDTFLGILCNMGPMLEASKVEKCDFWEIKIKTADSHHIAH